MFNSSNKLKYAFVFKHRNDCYITEINESFNSLEKPNNLSCDDDFLFSFDYTDILFVEVYNSPFDKDIWIADLDNICIDFVEITRITVNGPAFEFLHDLVRGEFDDVDIESLVFACVNKSKREIH